MNSLETKEKRQKENLRKKNRFKVYTYTLSRIPC